MFISLALPQCQGDLQKLKQSLGGALEVVKGMESLRLGTDGRLRRLGRLLGLDAGLKYN